MAIKTNAFVRQLASNKRTVRENALSTLKKFLSSPEKAKKITKVELDKLWKGLFYTMWFCDKPRPQQRLANELAKLFSESIVDEQFGNFVESYWTVMLKEWRELDKWRLDKFLMLMRYVVRECLVRLQKSEWDEKKVEEYLTVLTAVVVKDDNRIPRAITYHVIDVWVDELERVIFGEDEEEDEDNDEEEEDNEEEEDVEEKRQQRIAERRAKLEEQQVPMDALLAPFKALCGPKNFPALAKRVKVEILEDERLHALGVNVRLPRKRRNEDEQDVEEEEEEEEQEEEEEEEEEEWKGFSL